MHARCVSSCPHRTKLCVRLDEITAHPFFVEPQPRAPNRIRPLVWAIELRRGRRKAIHPTSFDNSRSMCETPISFYARAHTRQTDKSSLQERNNTHTLLNRQTHVLWNCFYHPSHMFGAASRQRPRYSTPCTSLCAPVIMCDSSVNCGERGPKLPPEIRFLRRPDSRAPLLVCPSSTLGFS